MYIGNTSINAYVNRRIDRLCIFKINFAKILDKFYTGKKEE